MLQENHKHSHAKKQIPETINGFRQNANVKNKVEAQKIQRYWRLKKMFENLEVRTIKTVTIDVSEIVNSLSGLFEKVPENHTEIFIPVCEETETAFKGTRTREILKDNGFAVRKSGKEFKVTKLEISEPENVPKKGKKN